MKLSFPRPQSPEALAPEARERAEQEAEKRGIPIDRICVVATPFGIARVIELDP